MSDPGAIMDLMTKTLAEPKDAAGRSQPPASQPVDAAPGNGHHNGHDNTGRTALAPGTPSQPAETSQPEPPPIMPLVLSGWSNAVSITIRNLAGIYELRRDKTGQLLSYDNREQLCRYIIEARFTTPEIYRCLVPGVVDDWLAATKANNIKPIILMHTARQELGQQLIRQWNSRFYNTLKTLQTIGPDTEHDSRPIDWSDRDQLYSYVMAQNQLPSEGPPAQTCREMVKMMIDKWIDLRTQHGIST